MRDRKDFFNFQSLNILCHNNLEIQKKTCNFAKILETKTGGYNYGNSNKSNTYPTGRRCFSL